MPQVVITLRIDLMNSARTARCPVAGFTPPLASFAAIIARSRQSTSTEHYLK